MNKSPFTLRLARSEDEAAVTDLLVKSYSKLLAADYDSEQLAKALPLITKANPALLNSGKYYIAEAESGKMIGCGGWTFERPGTAEINPRLAHVRHFATDPDWIRNGAARAILNLSIQHAKANGAEKLECYSTLSAVSFYQNSGFVRERIFEIQLTPNISFTSVFMRKSIDASN